MYKFPKCTVPSDDLSSEGLTTKEAYWGVAVREPDDWDGLEKCSYFEVMKVYPYEEKDPKTGGVYRSWYVKGNSNIFDDPSQPLTQGCAIVWYTEDDASKEDFNVSKISILEIRTIFEAMKLKIEIDTSFIDNYATVIEYIDFPEADLLHFDASEYKKVLKEKLPLAQQRYEEEMKEQKICKNYCSYEWRDLAITPYPEEDKGKIEFRTPIGDEGYNVYNYGDFMIDCEIRKHESAEWRYIDLD